MARYGGLVSFLLAAIWAYRWEAARAFLYEQGFNAMNAVETDTLTHWGVPLLLAVIGLVLFFKDGLPDWGLVLPPHRVPLHIAAQRLYEAVERAGALNLVMSPSEPPEKRLDHFKIYIMLNAELFGVKPPSTQALPIPTSELQRELYPVSGNASEIGHVASPGPTSTYINVTVRRRDLRRLIKEYLTESIEEVKLLRAGKWPR